MAYVIGDTVRLKATIYNLDGDEEAPALIKVSVYQKDGTVIIEDKVPDLESGTTAHYYYDWEISDTLTKRQDLYMVWWWTGPHQKKFMFKVEPIL